MEAAKPIEIETNKELEINSFKIIDTKKFDINLNNKKYILEFSKSENSKYIIFKISENNNFIDKYFSLNLNIDNFYGINVLFRLYQTIDEIYTFLLDIIIAKKYSVINPFLYFKVINFCKSVQTIKNKPIVKIKKQENIFLGEGF